MGILGHTSAGDTGALEIPTVNLDAVATDAARDDSGQADAPAVDAAGSDPGSVDVTAPDLSVPDPGSGDPSPPDSAAATEYFGGVLLAEVDSEFINTAVASARFTANPIPPAEQAFGDCGVSAVDPDNPAAPQYGFDAGVISIAATSPPVTLTPVSEGAAGTGYTSSLAADQQDLLPTVAALLTFQGAGGADIGAFTIVVQAPEPVSITAPDLGGLTGGSASKSSPLTVTWPSANGDTMLISLSPLSSDLVPAPVAGSAMVCVSAGDSGSFTIPVAALGAMGGGRHAMSLTRLKTNTGAAAGVTVSASLARSTGGLIDLN